MLNLILQGIIPVVFVIALGYYSGRKKIIDQGGARNFSAFIVKFALPCTLFVGIFNFTPQQLENVPYLVTLVLTLTIPFAIAVLIGRWGFRKPANEASLFGCNSGFPNMAYFGLPILASILGAQGLLPVIVGNLVTSIFLVPVIVFLLHHGGAVSPGQKRGSFVANILNTFKQSVVWAPILGLVLVLFGFKLPLLIKLPLQVIGNATGGVALFTLGVLLSALKFRVDFASVVVTLVKNLAMPALALGLGYIFRLDGVLVKGAVIIAACPSATIGAIFSTTYKVGEKTVPGQILFSTLFGVFSMAFWIYVVEKI